MKDMKSSQLLDAIGEIRDEYIQDAHGGHKLKRKKTNWGKWSAVAACLCLLLVVTAVISGRNKNLPGKHPDNTQKIAADEIYISVSSLLTSPDIISEQLLTVNEISVEDYKAVYEEVASVGSEILRKSTGKQISSSGETYYISGHDDLQYIIMPNEKGLFSLWKFQCFQSDNYPYRDVLRLIYNVTSAEDIKMVTIKPADMDNTDEGIKIQKKIGSLTLTKQQDINSLYEILISLTCYGSDKWDLIDYGASDNGMPEAVRLGRYLTLNLQNGCCIDSLKYTGISGMFYEYSGIAYNKLKKTDKKKIEKLLGI